MKTYCEQIKNPADGATYKFVGFPLPINAEIFFEQIGGSQEPITYKYDNSILEVTMPVFAKNPSQVNIGYKTKLTPGQEAPIEQWLAEMPEPYASAAIGQIDKNRKGYEPITKSIADAVLYFCDWDKTKELDNFWEAVNNYYEMAHKYPLPPYPPEHLPIEPAMPDFYVGMEIVAKVDNDYYTSGNTYRIYDTPLPYLYITTNGSFGKIMHKSDFHKYFTIKNQPMNPTIDPNELKPAKEWLKYLPEPIRTEALEACEKCPNWPEQICGFIDCLNRAINWGAPHGTNWNSIDEKLRRGEILPVQPEEVKEEKPTGPELVTYEEAINRLRAEVEATQKQNGKLQGEINFIKESMTQLLSKINPLLEQLKQERQATPTPEPDPIKLPLTIEEVWRQEKEMVGIVSWYNDSFGNIKVDVFNHANCTNEYRKESNAKKSKAFDTLLKIAEAQNEIAERGEWVWFAYNNNKAVGVQCFGKVLHGQIPFHSEQGLKDCIAANEQLFKDYLEI